MPDTNLATAARIAIQFNIEYLNTQYQELQNERDRIQSEEAIFPKGSATVARSKQRYADECSSYITARGDIGIENNFILASVSNRFRERLRQRHNEQLRRISHQQQPNEEVQRQANNVESRFNDLYDTIRQFLTDWYRLLAVNTETTSTVKLRGINRQAERLLPSLAKDWEKQLIKLQQQIRNSSLFCEAERYRGTPDFGRLRAEASLEASRASGVLRCLL